VNDTDHHNHSDDHIPDQVAPEPKPSDSDEALRLINEYADGLREYIEKLRRNLTEPVAVAILEVAGPAISATR
jgi:hypothetical protein